MKKKIFIAGDVREYDSANPTAFTDSITQYIKDNIVNPESAGCISTIAKEITTDLLLIKFPFTSGDEITKGTISDNLYRCFFGDCASFTPEYSLGFRLNFGSSYPINWRTPIDQLKEYHKKNSNYYHASRYENLDVEERPDGLYIFIQF